MRFWTDNRPESSRNRNADTCWRQLQFLKTYLTEEKKLDVRVLLFDFSETPQFSYSTHHPFDKESYQLAAKTNKILEYNHSNNIDVMMVLDADLFFSSSDFENVYQTLASVKTGDICTFDALNIKYEQISSFQNKCINIVPENIISKKYFYSPFPDRGPLWGCGGGLGGCFILQTELLQSIGGFNEEYKAWGGEDGDALDRIWGLRFKRKISLRPQRSYCPYHIDHFRDFRNVNYKNKNNPHLKK